MPTAPAPGAQGNVGEGTVLPQDHRELSRPDWKSDSNQPGIIVDRQLWVHFLPINDTCHGVKILRMTSVAGNSGEWTYE
jgi:hypothetical protein